MGKSLDLYDEQRGRIEVWQSIEVLRTLFFAETQKNLKKLETSGEQTVGGAPRCPSGHSRLDSSWQLRHNAVPAAYHPASGDATVCSKEEKT